jgi:hypothetical protein
MMCDESIYSEEAQKTYQDVLDKLLVKNKDLVGILSSAIIAEASMEPVTFEDITRTIEAMKRPWNT